MTRVNVVPVQELTREHLVAEYKEIMRLPKNIEKSLNRKSKPFSKDEIPQEYTMGQGHVKFFYNKMEWVKQRFEQLVQEMNRRGYTTNFTDSSMFDRCPKTWFNNYQPDEKAMSVNRARIEERLNDK